LKSNWALNKTRKAYASSQVSNVTFNLNIVTFNSNSLSDKEMVHHL